MFFLDSSAIGCSLPDTDILSPPFGPTAYAPSELASPPMLAFWKLKLRPSLSLMDSMSSLNPEILAVGDRLGGLDEAAFPSECRHGGLRRPLENAIVIVRAEVGEEAERLPRIYRR